MEPRGRIANQIESDDAAGPDAGHACTSSDDQGTEGFRLDFVSKCPGIAGQLFGEKVGKSRDIPEHCQIDLGVKFKWWMILHIVSRCDYEQPL